MGDNANHNTKNAEKLHGTSAAAMVQVHNDQSLFFAISVFFAQIDSVFSVVSYEISFQLKNELYRSKNSIEKCVCSDKTIKLQFFVKKRSMFCKINEV